MTDELKEQAETLLRECGKLKHSSLAGIEPLTGDMSTRRYVRLQLSGSGPKSVILMLLNHAQGPVKGGRPDVTQDDTFVEVGAFLSANGIRVPRLLLDARQGGALLVEDIGDVPLWRVALNDIRKSDEKVLERISGDAVSVLFKKAIDIIAKLQSIPQDPKALPFQRWAEFEWYRTTIREFSEYYAEPKGLKPSAKAVLEKVYDAICESIRAHPKTLAHFDYMAFNLFLDPDADLIVLDYQDASLNSPVRDIVSLINDRDMDSALGKSRHAELLRYFVEKVKPGKSFEQWYNEYLLHWDFRVSGRFIQLAEKRGKSQYQKWVSGTLRRLGRTLIRAHRSIHGLDDVLEILSKLSPEINEGVQDPWEIK